MTTKKRFSDRLLAEEQPPLSHGTNASDIFGHIQGRTAPSSIEQRCHLAATGGKKVVSSQRLRLILAPSSFKEHPKSKIVWAAGKIRAAGG